MATIHDEVNEKIELAKIYAEDGAFYSAARLLYEAAGIYTKRAGEIQIAMEDAADDEPDEKFIVDSEGNTGWIIP